MPHLSASQVKHALEQEYYDAIHRLQPDKLVLVGNPLCVDGEFYDAFHSKSHLWSTVQIGAKDVPASFAPGLITKKWVKDRAEDWGEDSPLYVASVLGEFPESMDDTMISLHAVNEAANRTSQATGPLILSVDVARFGKDESVILTRKGDVARIVQTLRGADLMKLANVVKVHIDTLHPDSTVIDTVGVGGGVFDRLKELGVRNLVGFVGGESPANPNGRYLNRIAESWWLMRDWFLKGNADIPNDKGLISQTAGRKYEVSGDRKLSWKVRKRWRKARTRLMPWQ